MTKILSMTKDAIRKRNKAFANLSPEKKRVAVANDVLLLLNSRKFKAMSGVYVESNKLDNLLVKNPDAEVCDLIPKAGTCNVCAKGALFLSAIMRKDDYKAEECVESSAYYDDESYSNVNDEENLCAYLGDIFDKDQLDEIENYFEGGAESDKFNDFTDNKRLRLIMENIVEFNGTFNSDKLIAKFPD